MAFTETMRPGYKAGDPQGVTNNVGALVTATPPDWLCAYDTVSVGEVAFANRDIKSGGSTMR